MVTFSRNRNPHDGQRITTNSVLGMAKITIALVLCLTIATVMGDVSYDGFDAYQNATLELRKHNTTYFPKDERLFRLYSTAKGFWWRKKGKAHDALLDVEDEVPKDVEKKAFDLMIELENGFAQFLEIDIWTQKGPLAAVTEIHKWMKGLIETASKFPPSPAINKALKELQELGKNTELLVAQTKEALEAGEPKEDVDDAVQYGIGGDPFPHPDYKNY